MKHPKKCNCPFCKANEGLLTGENNPNYKNGLPKCKDCNKTFKDHQKRDRCFKCLLKIRKGSNHPKWCGGKPNCKKCGILLKNYGSKLCNICYLKQMKGKKHPCWKGGISLLPYSFKFNKILKEKIRTRDKNICQKCKLSKIQSVLLWNQNLQVHHIDYNKKNCKENNLITLCRRCNSKVNFDRNYWKEYFKLRIKRKYGK